MNLSYRLFVLWFLLVPVFLLSGCDKGEETDEAAALKRAEDAQREAERQRIEAVFSSEIRSLSESELSVLGERNTLPTEVILPNALSVRVIQPIRFLQSSGAEGVVRFLGNNPTLVPFWNQFHQIELLITSTKIAPVSLLDIKSGEQVGENYPFPLQAVYAKKNEAVDQKAFLKASFGDLPGDRIQTEDMSGHQVSVAEMSRIVPLDTAGKNSAKVNGIAMAVFFPSDNEALMVTGPKDAVADFFEAREGDQRGVLAQRAGRLNTDNFDFAFLFDYASPQKDALTLPLPRDLAVNLWENASFLQFKIDANAGDGGEALVLDIAADSSEKLNKIDESIGNTLLQLNESLRAVSAQSEGEEVQQGMSSYLPQVGELLRSITKEKSEGEIRAVLQMSAERASLIASLIDETNRMSDESRKDFNRNMTARNLEILGQLINTGYYVQNNHFPPLAIQDKDGNPLLSWRVALLPLMGPEGEALYKEFKLDQPWDSEDNIKLLGRIPPIYSSPLISDQKGKTLFRIFSGEGVPFQAAGDPLKIQDLENPGKTFLIVSVDPSQAVEWTKPDVLEFDRTKLSEIFGDYVLAVPVMGEIFSAPFFGKPDEIDALAAWICGTADDSEEKVEDPEPNSSDNPLEDMPDN